MALAAGLASYLDAATLTSVSISLAIWSDHYRLELWQVGTLTAGLGLAVALGAAVGGWLGDRFGRGHVFSVDLVIFVVGTVVLLTAENGLQLMLGVVVVGLAAGADVPTSLAVIADSAPDRARGRLVALTQVLWIAGILVTFLLGFAVAGLGFAGTRILVAHLVVVAATTVALRFTVAARVHRVGAPAVPTTVTLRRLVTSPVLLPLLTTGTFFLFWNIAATTLGNYGSYFLINRTGLTQAGATGLVLLTFPPALIMAIAFVRMADSVWRDRLFVVAMVLQIAAFGLAAVTGGSVLWAMVGLIVLYSLSNVFAGEAVYKVWSQLLFPPDVRGTALGLTYALARATAAAFLVPVPALIARQPSALLWILTGCVVASGLTGLAIVRRPELLGSARSARPALDGTGARDGRCRR